MSTRITYQGRQFPSFTALAKYLALLTGRSVTSLQVALSSHQGNVTLALRSPRPCKVATPCVYQGQHFASRHALAKHLAPITGRSIDALQAALHRHQGNVTRAVRPPGPPLKVAIPCVYQGRRFPSRKALTEYLASITGKSAATLRAALTRYNGDIDRALQPRAKGNAIRVEYRGQHFPSLSALAEHLAPLTGLKRTSLLVLLSKYDGDVERVLARRTISPQGDFPSS